MLRLNIRPLGLLVILSTLVACSTNLEIKVLATNGRNIWRVSGSELDGNPETSEIVGGTYDNRIVCYNWQGALLWEKPLEAFPFDIECRDVNNDGRDEVFAALSNGTLLSFSDTGVERFRFQTPDGLPLFQVASVRLPNQEFSIAAGGIGAAVYCLNTDGEMQVTRDASFLGVVRFLLACDFDNSGVETLMAASSPIPEHRAMLWKGLALEPEWTQSAGPRARVDHVTEDMVFLPANGEAAKAVWVGGGKMQPNLQTRGTSASRLRIYTGDGSTEVRSLQGLDRFGLSDYVESNTKYAMYCTAPLTWEGRNAIAVLQAARIVMIDDSGAVCKAGTAPIGFSDIDVVTHDGQQFLLLGSSPNGDDNLYLLPVDADWASALAGLQPQGKQEKISGQLKDIHETLASRAVDVPPTTAQTDVIVRMYRVNTIDDIREAGEHIPAFLDYYRRNFPSDHIRYGVDLWLGRGSGRRMSETELLDFFRRLETTKSYFTIFASHGQNIGGNNESWYMPVDLAEKILDAAPTTCMALYSGEDEKIDLLPEWFDTYWRPMLDLCRGRGIKVYMKEKNMFWAVVPADEAFRERMLTPRYRGTLIPNTEDSNSRTPDVQLAGRVGLWASGFVDGWGIRLIGDAFSFNRQHEWEYPMTGHPSLRSMIAAYSLGAQNFMFEHGQFGQFTGDVLRDKDFNRVWEESDALFLQLIRTGTLRAPSREDLCMLSPVVLAIEQPSERFQRSGTNGHSYSPVRPDDGGEYAFGRLDCYWGLAPTHPDDLGHVLYGRDRQFGNFIPETPHGLVVAVPNATPDSQLPWMKTRVVTDGDYISIDGSHIPVTQASAVLKKLLIQYAEEFPFQCRGDEQIFFQVSRLDAQTFQIVLIDPGYLDPADRQIQLETHLAGDIAITDAVTQTRVEKTDNQWQVPVPAGGFRILRATIH